MSDSMKRIFISSVQKEFAKVRKQIKRFMSRNQAYRRYFDTFVFEEDIVACDRRADELYIDELRKCDIAVTYCNIHGLWENGITVS